MHVLLTNKSFKQTKKTPSKYGPMSVASRLSLTPNQLISLKIYFTFSCVALCYRFREIVVLRKLSQCYFRFTLFTFNTSNHYSVTITNQMRLESYVYVAKPSSCNLLFHPLCATSNTIRCDHLHLVILIPKGKKLQCNPKKKKNLPAPAS